MVSPPGVQDVGGRESVQGPAGLLQGRPNHRGGMGFHGFFHAILVTRTGPVAIFSDVPWEKHQERHAVDVALRQLFDEDVQAVVDGS